MSDENWEKKKESKQPLNSYKDRELKVGKAKWKKGRKVNAWK